MIVFAVVRCCSGPLPAEGTSLTNEGKGGGEDEKHAVAVHGEGDGKVGRQTAPHKELIHRCPIVGVQTQLGQTQR